MYSCGEIPFLNNKINLLRSPSQNSHVFTNLFMKCLLKCFSWLLLHFRQLNISNSSWVDMYAFKTRITICAFIILSIIYNLWFLNHSERLSTRLDNKLEISLKLSINFIFVCNSLIIFKLFIYWYWNIYVFFCIFFQIFNLFFKFFC